MKYIESVSTSSVIIKKDVISLPQHIRPKYLAITKKVDTKLLITDS